MTFKNIAPDRSRWVDPLDHERETDELIADAIIEDESPRSNCCGGPFVGETDFCYDCGEHASAEINGFTFPGNPLKFTITYDPISKDVLDLEKEDA